MLYEELKKRKKELGLTTAQLSALSGVPVGTINKILNGETKSPRYDTMAALERVLLHDHPDYSDAHASYPSPSVLSSADRVGEAAISYCAKKQGEYTLEDYSALPDDVRAELIDGHLIYMEAPTFTHQNIIACLLFELELYIRSNKGKCKVLPSPLDVQLDCNDKTIVQPDIIVICDKEKRKGKRIFGAPDLCIEIISPATRRIDYTIKTSKYANAGVREYWIVDEKRQTIVCYYFEGEDYPTMYTFHDKVPVRIYNGKLEIDFSDILERIEE